MDRDIRQLATQVEPSWTPLLVNSQLDEVQTQLTETANKLIGLPIYPKPEATFRAFTYKPISEIKVVIIGQDCYHGEDQAIGLCFGVTGETPCPPSLRNIIKELATDVEIQLKDTSLESWAQQGVLLLNSALTVHKSLAGSHLKIWNSYTDTIIQQFSTQTQNVCFLLWGNYAKSKKKLIATNQGHYILEANHPSPLSANRGGWFGTRHFSQVNKHLQQLGENPINW